MIVSPTNVLLGVLPFTGHVVVIRGTYTPGTNRSAGKVELNAPPRFSHQTSNWLNTTPPPACFSENFLCSIAKVLGSSLKQNARRFVPQVRLFVGSFDNTHDSKVITCFLN
jgi:hypothetical protein